MFIVYMRTEEYWECEVYDCDYFNPSQFKDFDKKYDYWYAVPKDKKGEEFLTKYDLI